MLAKSNLAQFGSCVVEHRLAEYCVIGRVLFIMVFFNSRFLHNMTANKPPLPFRHTSTVGPPPLVVGHTITTILLPVLT